MDKPLLNNKDEFPSEEILKKTLGKTYECYQELKTISTNELDLVYNWNFYNDSKCWLCKVAYKKKTIFWLSIWTQFFKTGFYFTAKNCNGINDLDISNEIKENFAKSKPIGKLIPLILEIDKNEIINDCLKIIEYKKKLK